MENLACDFVRLHGFVANSRHFPIATERKSRETGIFVSSTIRTFVVIAAVDFAGECLSLYNSVMFPAGHG